MKHQDLNECYCRTTNKLEINLCNSGGFFPAEFSVQAVILHLHILVFLKLLKQVLSDTK